jgi:drug/metabolite transporter (DMT)-like permease
LNSSEAKPAWSQRVLLLGLMVTHVSVTGFGYVVNKLATMEFNPFAYAFWRLCVGILGLTALLTITKSWPKIDRADYPRILLLAIVSVPINQVIYLVGISKTMPSHASLLYGTTAVFALFLSAAMGYEKILRHKILAITVSLTGLIVIVTQGGAFDVSSQMFTGDVLIFSAVLAWASYTVLGKPIVRKYGAIPTTGVVLLIGSFVALPFLAYPAMEQDYARLTWIGWGGVLYAGLVLSVLAYSVWYKILTMIDPSQVAILTTPQPVVATTFSTFIVGEVIGWPIVVGGILVIAGIVLMDAPAFARRANSLRKRVLS